METSYHSKSKTEHQSCREEDKSQNKADNISFTTEIMDDSTVVDTVMHLDLLKQDVRHFSNTDIVDANAHSLIGDERASVSSSESGHSWMEMRFQLHADAMRFSQFVQLSVVFASMYSMTASIAFFSSLYPVAQTQAPRHSTVDAFLLTSAIIAIDITSAFFVVTGFFCAYTLTNVNSSDVTMLFRIVVLHTVIDIWLATLLSVIFGSIFHILRGTFSPHDITLTMIEGITCLRTFELSQSPDSMHSLNPTSWPVLCLLYCFVLTPWTMASNHRLHSCYPRAGLLLLLINAFV